MFFVMCKRKREAIKSWDAFEADFFRNRDLMLGLLIRAEEPNICFRRIQFCAFGVSEEWNVGESKGCAHAVIRQMMTTVRASALVT